MTSKLRDRQTTVQWTTRNGTQVEHFLRDDEDIAREVRSLQRTHPALAQAKYLEALRYVIEHSRALSLEEMCEMTGWNPRTVQNRISQGKWINEQLPVHRRGKAQVFYLDEVLRYIRLEEPRRQGRKQCQSLTKED